MFCTSTFEESYFWGIWDVQFFQVEANLNLKNFTWTDLHEKSQNGVSAKFSAAFHRVSFYGKIQLVTSHLLLAPAPALRHPLTWPKESKHNPWKTWKKEDAIMVKKKTEINTHRHRYIFFYMYLHLPKLGCAINPYPNPPKLGTRCFWASQV